MFRNFPFILLCFVFKYIILNMQKLLDEEKVETKTIIQGRN